MANYGSKAEGKFAAETCGFLPIHGKHFRHPKTRQFLRFLDRNGHEFRAQGDFWHKPTKTIVEYKCDELNFIPSLVDSDAALSDFRGGKYRRIKECCWSNSAIKHKIIQDDLSALGIKYIVVFDESYTPEAEYAKRLDRLQLHWTEQRNIEFFIGGVSGGSGWDF
ncbi:hypothetical protein [Enterovibrio baiacu]|uniref:hypothetical protein n=1 Tax=Enterovibrio baiacu TaxID=2491023 RepID=UPI0010119307|nr:hypothetical protein [Enterovibrio baiacu]MBE1275086.1 hypothetical protein [Enterovibrio baiacu]